MINMINETRWTEEQLEAITGKDCSLLVAAAAGAGKTAVLVERIIRKITCGENPPDIDRLLVVTFTNAAATEMRERIAGAISGILDKSPGSKQLLRQLALLNNASITTIHSFCLEVIRNNCHFIGLNPGFRIADETEALLTKMEALDELFEEIYENENVEPGEEFFDLLESYGGNGNDQALKDIVFSLHEFTREFPWPNDWLREKVEYFNLDTKEDFAKTRWGELLLKSAAIELENMSEMMKKAFSIVSTGEGLKPYTDNFNEEIKRISSLAELCGSAPAWDDFCGALSAIRFDRLPSCKKDADKEAQEYVKSIRNEVKARIGKLKDDIFMDSSCGTIKKLKRLYPLLKRLAGLVMEFDAKYAQKKAEKSILDFNDLEHFCLDILTIRKENGEYAPSEVALEYRERFVEILVDEYQDSNLVQEIILNSISRKDSGTPNIFMVGDVKQSIYRFRQARPELFLEKYNTYPEGKDGKYRKIRLYKNFRSRREIIDSVNFIFSRIMSRYVGEMDYNEEESLNPGAVFEADFGTGVETNENHEGCGTDDKADNTGKPDTASHACIHGSRQTELHLIETGKDKEMRESRDEALDEGVDGNTSNVNKENPANGKNSAYGKNPSGSETPAGNEKPASSETPASNENPAEPAYRGDWGDDIPESARYEARVAAGRIKELVNAFKVYDNQKKQYRPAEYRDIVVLLRSTRNLADIFVEEFAAEGIPVYADTAAGFFKTIEVQVMMSLLQVIDNPLQDIPLLAVLRSPVVMLTPDELADIRLADKDAPLYEALKKLAGYDEYSCEENNPEEYSCDEYSCRKKVLNFLKTLEKWRSKALYMSTEEMIWYLYTETGFYAYVGAMPDGEQRQANLRMLFEQARRYEETSYRGLFNFINFINKLKSGVGDMGSAKILGENENVVRLMSIHKSKGLEFPVVIISGCGKNFNLRDMNESIILHQELGFGPDYIDLEKRTGYPSLAKQALRYKIKAESLSEEMRILYVGFTRAKEKLILTGTVRDLGKSILKWRGQAYTHDGKIPGHVVFGGRNYLDWICPALMTGKVSRERFFNSQEGSDRKISDNESNNQEINDKAGSNLKSNGIAGNNPESNDKWNNNKGSNGSKIDTGSCKTDSEGYSWDIRLWSMEGEDTGGVFRKPGSEKQPGQDRDFYTETGSIIGGTSENVFDAGAVESGTAGGGAVESEHGVLYNEVRRRLEWEYKYNEASRIPVKVSVTELKRRFAFEHSEEYPAFKAYTPTLIKKPAFLEESRKLDAARVGTAMHFVMQHLDFKRVDSEEQIKSQVGEMVEKELLTVQQAEATDTGKIYGFFCSALGKRMLDSIKVYREVPFNMEIKSGDLYTHLKGSIYEDEALLLQGVIDCFFEEEDGLVLLDYKSDYIGRGDGKDAINRIREQYKIQIRYYAIALEKLLKKKVKEKYIYLFAAGQAIEC